MLEATYHLKIRGLDRKFTSDQVLELLQTDADTALDRLSEIDKDVAKLESILATLREVAGKADAELLLTRRHKEQVERVVNSMRSKITILRGVG